MLSLLCHHSLPSGALAVAENLRVFSQATQASESSAERHSGALLGGYKELESTDLDAREAAEFATEQLSSEAKSPHPWQLKKVLGGREEARGRGGGHPEVL